MNTNLHIALANEHQRELRRQAGSAERASGSRSPWVSSITCSVRAVWVRSRRLGSDLARLGALPVPAPLAGDSRASAPHVRW